MQAIIFKNIALIVILLTHFLSDFNFVIKERREVILYEIYNIVQTYGFVIDEYSPTSDCVFRSQPFIVDDIACKLEVYIIYHGLNTYKLRFTFKFYQITPNGLVKTNTINQTLFNLLNNLKSDVRQTFFFRILYEND